MGLFGGNGGDAASPPMRSPLDGLGEDNPLSLQADETAARQLDTGFATEVRGLVHDPATGLAGRDPEAALAGIPETIPLLAELKDRYLAQAAGPRQKALLEPLIDHRLERAGVYLGRIVHQATSVLDDRSVSERVADLKQDASLLWQDKAHLRLLGRTVVNELRYQGERKGWDAGQTDTAVRTGLSDLYAGAVEAAIVQDPERAATLYDHARVVIQPDRQAAVERKIQRANEERRVTEIVGGLADMPDDPTRRPDLDDYQARAAEATPPDASPEVRAQVSRMASIEQARTDQAWQAKRGRAATGALDWLGANPAAPLMAMPTALRDGLSPEQTEALDRTVMNGGRVVTDRDLYDRLDDQSVRDPESFAAIDLTQHRLSLGDSDYDRLTKRQQALAEGKPDPAFERHRLGRLFLEEGLRNANVDPDGAEARTARQQLDTLLGAFEAVEGRPPTMADIRGLVGDVVSGVLPRAESVSNIVRVSGSEPVETPLQEGAAKDALDRAEPRIIHNDDGSAEVGAAFDPQDIILAQAGGGGARGGGSGRVSPPPRAPAPPGQRPIPGPGHNQPPQDLPPGLPTLINRLRPGSYPAQQPGTQPAPDSAGPAAAEQKAARERADTYTTYREHLQELDPDNPLLKLEPVPGVPPDQVTVDGIQKEVGTIVQRKLARFAWPNYPSKDRVHGTRNGAARELPGGLEQAEKDFAELSKRGTPVKGPYGRDNVLNRRVQLPGTEMTVGIRLNRDGIPSLDIGSPETGYKKYHYK